MIRNGETGSIVEKENDEQIEENLYELVSDSEERMRFGRNFVKEHYDWEKM